jgi:2-dehydropantoate 2-reductase
MQRQQVSEILPVLKRNRKIPFFIFMGNNVNGAEEYLKFLDRDRVMLGFGGPGGYREGHSVIAAYVKDHTILYFGEPDGSISSRVEMIKSVFQDSQIKVDIPENIDAWLKTHAAFICALVMASYAAKNRNKKITDEDRLITKGIKAFRENLKALEEIGVKILPEKFKIMKFIPAFFLKRKLKNLIDSEFGRVALSGHADSAKNEMVKLSEDFRNLVRDVRVDMSANDYLYRNSFMKNREKS